MKKPKKPTPAVKKADKTLEKLQERVEKLEGIGVRQMEKRQKLVIQILELLNHPGDKKDSIRRILLLMKEFTGLECVAIRLKEGDDYPYYVTSGFSDDFVEAERSLCTRDDRCQVVRDNDGYPILECMCGNVIRGRTDPAQPFFSPGGSFWSNWTTQLLATTSEKERQSRTRNRCNGEGYESVALIPLRVDTETVGLLQLNDSRKNMFTGEMIQFFERIGLAIGIAFKREQMDAELKKHREHLEELVAQRTKELVKTEERYRDTMDSMLEGCQIIGSDWRYLYLNDASARQGKQPKEALLGRTMMEVYPGIEKTEMFAALKRSMSERTHQRMENKFTFPDGSTGWFELSFHPVPEGVFILSLDVSGIKRAEEELRHLNNVLRAIRNINQLIVRERDRDRLIQEACDKLIETRGYLSAWIILFDKQGKYLTATQAGLDEYFLPLAELFKSGKLPHCAHLALKKPGPQIISDPAKSCSACPVSKKYPAKSSMAVRLEYNGRVYGILAVAIPPHITAMDEEQDLFTEVSGDIAFALHNMEEEQSRTRAESSLKDSEERLKVVFDNAQDGIALADARTRKFYTANKSFCKMLGYTLEEIRQLDAMHIHPAKDVPYVMEQFERQLKGEIDLAADIPVKRKDGSVFYADINASPITLEGKTYLLGIFRDITERKKAEQALRQSEEHFRFLFNNMLNGFAHCRMFYENGRPTDFVYLDVNSNFEKLTGLKDVVNKKVTEVIPGVRESSPELFEIYGRVARTGRPEQFEIYIEPLKMWFSISVYSPQKEHFVAVFDVITDRKQAEAEKEKIQSQLFQAQKLESVGTLAGGVAHDFNNIIGAIRGFAELSLMDTDKTSPIYEYIKNIVSSTDRAGNLTRQLLIFSRSHSAELKALNLNETVHNILKMLTRLIGEDIKIEAKLAPDAGIIKADAGNIEQVLMNLVVNARDAIHTGASTEGSPAGMPKGGVITIKTENVKVDQKYCDLNIEGRCGDFVCLTVSDTGTGMTKEVLSHMFEPFYTTKKEGKGTGLGLSVVYGIVKKHNGWINVYSEPGSGTVFKIYLPVATAGSPVGKPDTKIIPPEQLRGKSERVLVVEDDDGIRKLVTNALEKMNYNVFVAASGAEARQLFDKENGEFRLILSDVVLTDTNGVDLCDELTKDKPGVCVLLSSGYASKGEYSNAIQARGLNFISKPYNLNTLFKTIREILEGKT